MDTTATPAITRRRPPKGQVAAVREAAESSVVRSAFDRDYWLAHCEGYRVDSVDGRLGFVEHVRDAGDAAGTVTLAVRAGLMGRRLLLVPGSEVAFIVPREKRIWLRSPVAINGSEAARGRPAERALEAAPRRDQ